MIRNVSGYQNFSTLGVTIILTLGCTLIILGWIIDIVVGWIQKVVFRRNFARLRFVFFIFFILRTVSRDEGRKYIRSPTPSNDLCHEEIDYKIDSERQIADSFKNVGAIRTLPFIPSLKAFLVFAILLGVMLTSRS